MRITIYSYYLIIDRSFTVTREKPPVNDNVPWKEDMKRERSSGGIQWPITAYIAGHVSPWF